MTYVLHKINVNLTSVVPTDEESTVPCGDCTLCCQLLSPCLTPEEINSGKYPISLTQPTPDVLKLDPTAGAVVTMFKNAQGGCGQFINNKCAIYEDRPLACRVFDCRKGHHVKTNAVAQDKFGISLNTSANTSANL